MNSVFGKRALAYLFFAGLVGMQIMGCRSVLCSDEETLRLSSPDTALDAVLVQSDCGATTSTEYILYIVPKGKKCKSGYQSLVMDHVEGLKVFWGQDKFLVIQYDEGRVFQFTNFWESKEVQNFRYVVELRLMPTSKTFSLSEEDRRLKY